MSVKVVNLSPFDEKLVDLMMSQIGIMIFYFPMLLLLRESRERGERQRERELITSKVIINTSGILVQIPRFYKKTKF